MVQVVQVVAGLSKRRVLRALLSVAIVWHLAAILIAPNKDTYLALKAAPLIEPYVNFLELASSWNFFAPDPGPPPIYVEWEVLDSKLGTLERGRWPETADPYFLRERQNRRIASARFMAFSDTRTEQILLPYLCRTRAGTGAHSIRLWRTVYTIPGIKEVVDGKRTIGDDVGVDRHWVSHSFCQGKST